MFLSLFAPTKNNEYRAYLLRKPAQLFLLFIFLAFNLFVGVDFANVQASNKSITIQNLLNYHNREREAEGLSALKLNNKLGESATAKAKVMLKNDCWSHYCPPGKSPWEFFDSAGYRYVYAGENLAEGFYDMSTLMRAWMNSKTHKENILKEEYKEVGFGIVYGEYQNNKNNVIITVHFGSRNDFGGERKLVITNPISGEEFNADYVDVEGKAENVDKVYVVKDEVTVGSADADEGIFTYRLLDLENGKHNLYVSSADDGEEVSSDVITFEVSSKAQTLSSGDSSVADSLASLELTTINPSVKNLINLAFVIFMIILFLVDFIIMRKSDIVRPENGKSQLHLGVFVVVFLVILAGGLGGSVLNGGLSV